MKSKKCNVNRNNLKCGDIFSFKLEDGAYGYGIIVSKINEGHVAELYKKISDNPSPQPEELLETATHYPPVILDTLSLLERRTEGDWCLIGHDAHYEPSIKVKETKFVWGILGNRKTTDIFNQHQKITDADASQWPFAIPFGDWDVKEYLKNKNEV